MSYKIKFNIKAKEWEIICKELDESSYFSSYEMINYYCNYDNIKNISFVVFSDENKALALVPLAIYKNSLNFPNDPCPSISINKNLKKYEKKKILKFCFGEIKKILVENKLDTYFFFKHPFQNKIRNNILTMENLFEHLQFSKLDKICNTSILNLNKNEDELFSSMSKYHKKNLKKIYKDNNFIFHSSQNLSKDKKLQIFESFQFQHLKNSGKKTRSQKTWELMYSFLIDDKAILYFLTFEKKYISYLFVGVNENTAFGWSQVNDKNYEAKLMPRHFLEWEAIKNLKKQGKLYYDIGEIYDWHQKDISDKQFQISNFKEKYAGSLYPKIFFKMKLEDFEKI